MTDDPRPQPPSGDGLPVGGGSLRRGSPGVGGTAGLRRSPLAHRHADLAAVGDGVTLGELPFQSMISLRVAPESAGAERVRQVLGVALPGSGMVATANRGVAVLWLGPDEWLVVGPDGEAPALVTLLTAALADGAGSIVDVSANRTTVVLGGANARDLLEKGCTLDLHPRSFTAGRCAQTTFARGHVLLWQTVAEPSSTLISEPENRRGPEMQVYSGSGAAAHLAEPEVFVDSESHPASASGFAPTPGFGSGSGPEYRLLIRGSFGDYFADWLTDAAVEFGPDTGSAPAVEGALAGHSFGTVRAHT